MGGAAREGLDQADIIQECKLCWRKQPQDAFQAKQWKRALSSRSACCAECQAALASLKRLAGAAASAEPHVHPLEVVTEDTMPFWEEALAELLFVEDPAKRWLPGMLRRWLDVEREAQALQEAVPAVPSALRQSMDSEPYPQWLEELRSERVLRYDQDAFPFERIFCEMFETSDLEQLHKAPPPERPPSCPTLLRAYRLAGVKRPKAWRQKEKWQQRHVQQFRSSGPYTRFLEAYCRFIQEMVLPLVGRGEELLFQCPPTLRCQMPSIAPMGRAHRDSDFAAHHGAEINFWVPVTRVWGSNSLQVESEPGRGDFHALELGPGELVVFNGSRCLHYTEANRTDSVRVSFDFRVIPKSLVGTWRHATSAGTTSELAHYDFVSTG